MVQGYTPFACLTWDGAVPLLCAGPPEATTQDDAWSCLVPPQGIFRGPLVTSLWKQRMCHIQEQRHNFLYLGNKRPAEASESCFLAD